MGNTAGDTWPEVFLKVNVLKDKEGEGQEQCSRFEDNMGGEECFHCLDDAGAFMHYTHVSPHETVHLSLYFIACQSYLDKCIF